MISNFLQRQIGGFLPALILVAITVAKALGVGAAGYAGTKFAQKAFGDCIKRNLKKNSAKLREPKAISEEAEDIWIKE